MKSSRMSTILLFLVYLILPVTLILMYHHITLCDTLSKMDGGVFGDSSSIISFKSDKSGINDISDLKNITESYAAFSDYDCDDYTVRALYFNNDYVNLPMKSGRFFINSDFKDNSYTAVIGKSLEKKVFSENNKKYINIGKIKYEVIGILGYENKTFFDDFIFINGKTSNSVFTSKLCTIDILKADNKDTFISNMVSTLNKNNHKCKQLEYGGSLSESILPVFDYARFFIFILIINIVCILLISVQWINRQKKGYCIKRLLGASNFRIFLSLLVKYMAIILLSCVVAYIYCNVFYSTYISNLLFGYGILIPVVLIFLLISTFIILTEPIEEAIK